MRRAKVVTATIVIGLLVGVAGCSREPAAAPAAEPPERDRTRFFSQLAAEPNAGALKGGLQPKFPNLDLHVGRAGPAYIRSGADQPWLAQVEVQLVVQRGNFEEARDRLLSALEEYLKGLAASTGTEIGPVREELKDGKKIGFHFDYRSPENTGTVTVGPQENVADAFMVIVAEWR